MSLRRTVRHALPCRESRHMIYTRALTGDSVGALLGLLVVGLFAAIALMGG